MENAVGTMGKIRRKKMLITIMPEMEAYIKEHLKDILKPKFLVSEPNPYGAERRAMSFEFRGSQKDMDFYVRGKISLFIVSRKRDEKEDQTKGESEGKEKARQAGEG